jgi:hypothetical protein
MKYYYLVSSLPHFAFGDPPPVSEADFLAECKREMAEDEFFKVRAVLSGEADPGDSPPLRRWLAGDRELRNALAQHRAGRWAADAARHVRQDVGLSVYAMEAVEDAYAKPHPLERELELDRFRWGLLEEILLGHYFDLTAVLVYGLKLKIAARWSSMNEEAGKARLEASLKAALQAATEEAQGSTVAS